MRVIELDAGNWRTPSDFYDALLAALGSPKWHGRNVNALADSMVYGGINSIAPPYTVQISNADHLPTAVREAIITTAAVIEAVCADRRARAGVDTHVKLQLAKPSPTSPMRRP